MIPELIISGEDAKGEFLMSVPRKMPVSYTHLTLPTTPYV